MNNYKKDLEDKLKENNVKCPYCGCKDIGIDKAPRTLVTLVVS